MVIKTKHTGKNLQQLRIDNKKNIIRLLRKGEFSGREISRTLELSPAGVQSLIDEMLEDGILIKKNATNVLRGRRSINIEINPEIGVVAVVKFETAEKYNIKVCDFHANVLFEHTRKAETEQDDLLNYLIQDLEDLIKKSNKTLYSIAVSSSGKIEKETGAFHYAPSMGKYEKFNLKKLLEQHFQVGVVVKNKTIFLLRSERTGSKKIELQNGLYIHDLGCAICIDGRIFEGANGYAGEFGMLMMDTYGVMNEQGFYNPYRSNYFMAAYAGLEQAVSHELGQTLTKRDIFRMYNENNEKVRVSVEKFLHMYALVIRNLVGFMDLQQVVVGGTLAELNDEAFLLLSNYVNNGIMDTLNIQIIRANPQNNYFNGGFEYAMDIAYETLIGGHIKNYEKGAMDLDKTKTE